MAATKSLLDDLFRTGLFAKGDIFRTDDQRKTPLPAPFRSITRSTPINKRASARKQNYLFVLPGRLQLKSFTPSASASASASASSSASSSSPATATATVSSSAGEHIGRIENLDTENPIVYLHFPQGRLKLYGALLRPVNQYIRMNLRPGEIHCSETIDQIVVFPRAAWIGSVDLNPEEHHLMLPKEIEKVILGNEKLAVAGSDLNDNNDDFGDDDEEQDDDDDEGSSSTKKASPPADNRRKSSSTSIRKRKTKNEETEDPQDLDESLSHEIIADRNSNPKKQIKNATPLSAKRSTSGRPAKRVVHSIDESDNSDDGGNEMNDLDDDDTPARASMPRRARPQRIPVDSDQDPTDDSDGESNEMDSDIVNDADDDEGDDQSTEKKMNERKRKRKHHVDDEDSENVQPLRKSSRAKSPRLTASVKSKIAADADEEEEDDDDENEDEWREEEVEDEDDDDFAAYTPSKRKGR